LVRAKVRAGREPKSRKAAPSKFSIRLLGKLEAYSNPTEAV